MRIKKLPPSVVKRIAAGEVVERPASVVKELVENSLDAKSRVVTVRIKDGGKSLIEVADDGIGMTEKEAVLAVERHTTSKVESPEDLEAVTTFGFRGEALYAISSVSIFELITRTGSEDLATRIVVEGGILKKVEKTARERGTTVRVSNLFFNVAARRKFLRSKRLESQHVRRVVLEAALAFPEVEFRLFEDSEPVFVLRPGDLRRRVEDALAGRVVEEREEDFGFALARLFLVKSEDLLGDVFIFVNKRPVSERQIAGLIKKHLKQRFLGWELPFAVLFLELDPRDVDVNVHPAKREVRFREKEKILFAVNKLLEGKTFSQIPSGIEKSPRQTDLSESLGIFNFEFIGEYAGLYFLYEDKKTQDLLFVDKHALHERIIFERIAKGEFARHPVFLPLKGLKRCEDLESFLKEMGFSIDFEAEVLLSVPDWAYGRDYKFFRDLFGELESVSNPSYEELARRACRLAVKAGDESSKLDAKEALKFLAEHGFDLSCPHGRPVVVRVKKSEVDSLFKRRK